MAIGCLPSIPKSALLKPQVQKKARALQHRAFEPITRRIKACLQSEKATQPEGLAWSVPLGPQVWQRVLSRLSSQPAFWLPF